MADIGKKAPAFSLKNQEDETVKLSDLKGKWVILYFYPKDLTPGCTTEACDFTEALPNFSKANAEIYGVSPDTVEMHQKFMNKKELKINLLADIDHKITEKYGLWQLKKFMGKEFMGVVRTTYIIDPDGKIAHAWPKVKVAGHAQAVLEKLKELQA